MGPSGSGKTTLLNVLAHRVASADAQVSGQVLINDHQPTQAKLRQISTYVEQDSLIGSLTVRETVDFAARLSLPSTVSKEARRTRVDGLLQSFGLNEQANLLVGTPIRKGISGGQKRRLGVASQLVTSPKIVFLDEPTSGLDSTASYEVMRFIKDIAEKNRLVVIASIHQPSTATFELFDKLVLHSGGKTCYSGSVEGTMPYFAAISYSMPLYINPAEFLLDLVNPDFAKDRAASHQRINGIHEEWARSAEINSLKSTSSIMSNNEKEPQLTDGLDNRSQFLQPVTLLHRNFIKSYRDVIG